MRWNEYFWGITCVCSDIQAGLAFYKRILFWFAFFGAWKGAAQKGKEKEKDKDQEIKDKKTEGGASMGCIGVNEMWFFKFMKWDEMSTFGESLVLMYKQDWHFIKGFYFGLFFLVLEKELRRKSKEKEKDKDQKIKDKKTEGGASMGCIGVNDVIFQIYEMRWNEYFWGITCVCFDA